MEMINQANLGRLFTKFDSLLPVVKKLNNLNIPWMIGGSGSLYLLGNHREPVDVDILLPNTFHDVVDQAFGIKSFIYTSPQENVRNSNPDGNHDIQFTSHLKITIAPQKFDLFISESIINHQITTVFNGESVYLLPPEDVILIKAILQRGEDVGKHDIADIQAFVDTGYKLDIQYLNFRIAEVDAQDRVSSKLSFLL